MRMQEIQIKLVGMPVRVTGLQETALPLFADYLSEEKPESDITVTKADVAFEREKSRREDALEGIPVREFSDEYLETLALQRKLTELFFEKGILLFHGSVVAVDGEGYLFTAKSGTGKSTHTRLWREYLGERAVMVNDDKPFLKLHGERVIAYGTPWNGKHQLGCNMSVPLKTICILERGEKNEIEPITPREALPMLVQQSQRPMDRKKLGLYLDLVDQLSKKVAFYRLRCNMELEAAKVSFEAMSADRKEK